MISNEELEKFFYDTGKVFLVQSKGDGYHYHVTIVSDEFVGLLKLARQKWVYALVGGLITEGRLHALTMDTFTKAEWEQQDG